MGMGFGPGPDHILAFMTDSLDLTEAQQAQFCGASVQCAGEFARGIPACDERRNFVFGEALDQIGQSLLIGTVKYGRCHG